MAVKEGYKKTAVGVIPEDWEVTTIGQLGIFSKGQGIRKDEALSGSIPCVRYGEIYTIHNDYIKRFGSFISEEVAKTSKMLKQGDILFAGSGETKEEIGKSVAFIDHFKAYVGGDVIVFSPKYGNSLFYGYLLNSPVIVKQKASKGQGDAVVHISASILSNIQIPLPPLPEQKAIATALSDIDGLISSLTKLIEKKKNIKQGAMQDLLKPKKGWFQRTLGETATLKARIGWQGLTTSEYQKDGDYYLITGTDFINGHIHWENCCFVDESRYNQDRNIQVKESDVIVTKDGTIGKTAFINTLPKPATLNSGVFVIRPINKSFLPHYFYYVMMSETFTDFLVQLSAGSTINHLYQKDFVNFSFYTPPTIEEQTAIATILSDMDSEIEKLQTKLNKYKAIKQGMMQELLTGRIRLLEGA